LTWVLDSTTSFACSIAGIADVVGTGTFSHMMEFMPTSTTGWGFYAARVFPGDTIPHIYVQTQYYAYIQMGPSSIQFTSPSDLNGNRVKMAVGSWSSIQVDCVSWSCRATVNGQAMGSGSLVPAAPIGTSVLI
jgi:hypothetical protein